MDIDKKMCKEWEHSFQKYKDVEAVNCEFTQFMKEHPEVDAIGIDDRRDCYDGKSKTHRRRRKYDFKFG